MKNMYIIGGPMGVMHPQSIIDAIVDKLDITCCDIKCIFLVADKGVCMEKDWRCCNGEK